MGALLERVHKYFDACNGGDAGQLAQHFTEDARIYDLNHSPVVGREAIGKFWASIARKWGGARWFVDTAVESETSVAVEWTMRGTTRGEPFVVRGSEHYEFERDLIREIRQYWKFSPDKPGCELVDFPYSKAPRFR